MKIIDLSQTIVNRMQVYPGDEPPMLYRTHSLDFDEYTNFQLTIGMHTGTHIDGPMHMVKDNRLICDIPPENFIGKGCIIDIRGLKEFDDYDIVKQKAAGYQALLFYTGFGTCFGTPQYLNNHPLISQRVAQTIVDLGIKLFGIDTFSPDNAPYNIHKILFRNNVIIAENLVNLDQLLTIKDFTIIALPLKIQADSAPARVVATVDE